jgi:hypothetical protein
MRDLSKVWTLFISDPVTFISLFGGLAVVVAAFIWWFRGYLDKERLEIANLRLELARDQEKLSTTQLETARKENQELRDRLDSIPIDVAPGISELAGGTASALDQALVANSALRSTLSGAPDYFGFKSDSTRSRIAPLFARQMGATQAEANELSKTLPSEQENYYRMLGQTKRWGHGVVWWDDPNRGKVFKLIYNPNHSGPRGNAPPSNWKEMNRPDPPPGVLPKPWEGKSI